MQENHSQWEPYQSRYFQVSDNTACGAGSSDSDDEQFHTVFRSVIGIEDIWNAFQAEKKSSATHAFGWQRLEDGSEGERPSVSTGSIT